MQCKQYLNYLKEIFNESVKKIICLKFILVRVRDSICFLEEKQCKINSTTSSTISIELQVILHRRIEDCELILTWEMLFKYYIGRINSI